MRLLARIVAAVAAGLLLDASQPGFGVWILALPAVALFFASIFGASIRVAALIGLVGGSAFWLPHLNWLTIYLGPIPWLALSGLMIFWFTLFQMLAALGINSMMAGAARASHLRQLVLSMGAAVIYSGFWVARELLESAVPYGGFAWGRLAASFVETPLKEAIAYTGVAAFAGLVVWCIAFPTALLLTKSSIKFINTGFIISALIFVLVVFLPLPTLQQTGTLNVAAVQGNAKAGIFDNRENGDVFLAHYSATAEYIDGVQSASEMPDIIVWPENAAEFAVTENSGRRALLTSLATSAQAPIVVGTIIRDNQSAGADPQFFNSAITISPTGAEISRYDKRNPVPFGEYMPNRNFFHALVPDLVELVQLEYQHGQTGVSSLIAGARIGQAICFDITFDRHTNLMLAEEAEILFALTNNADFGDTDQSVQQLALTKLQAISSGRALVNVSTVGQSQLLLPDGSAVSSIESFTSGVISAELPKYEGYTPATILGGWFAGAAVTSAVLLVCAGIVIQKRQRSSQKIKHGQLG